MTTFFLPGLPVPLSWHIEPPEWQIDSIGALRMFSGPINDYFHDPATGRRTASAPCALLKIDEPSFVLSACVEMIGHETFDAAALFVRLSDDIWAKLCLENSPDGKPTIVSVVTRGVSDDCNSATLADAAVYLRVAKTPNTVAFHYSLDGSYWRLVRYFSLGEMLSASIGLIAQSPIGQGARAIFSGFHFWEGELPNLRDGQ